MIRKFATAPRANIVPALILATILAGATAVHAQQDSAQQPPAQQPSSQQPSTQQQPENPQSSSSQETAAEEMPGRKLKVKDYKNWVFNVGGGANMTSGTTSTFVRGGGGVAAAGVARNYNRYFGIRFDFQWDNLPLRQTALALAQAPSATSHSYTFMLDPIVNIPVTRNWGGYVLGGVTYFHRSGKLESSTAIPGSACTPFFQWWGTCFNASIPLSGNFLNASENQFGENFGGGITRVIRPNIQFYAEWRLLHGKRGNTTTDFRPITIGIRW
jgi:hypothetical protein